MYQGDAALTLAQAGEIVLRVAPNAAHKYSDLAYQLLGAIVTSVSGMPYSRYLHQSVLGPLGMSATGFEPLTGTLPHRRATGYGWRSLSDERDPAPGMPPVWAEGGLWSCIEDLGRCISFRARLPEPRGGLAGPGRGFAAGDAQSALPGRSRLDTGVVLLLVRELPR